MSMVILAIYDIANAHVWLYMSLIWLIGGCVFKVYVIERKIDWLIVNTKSR